MSQAIIILDSTKKSLCKLCPCVLNNVILQNTKLSPAQTTKSTEICQTSLHSLEQN